MGSIMRMPEVLANATEAIITKWILPEGSKFSVGDLMAEVETEKALVEVPAETDGILGKYLAKEGAPVAIGSPIAILLNAGEGEAELARLLEESGVSNSSSIIETGAPRVEQIKKIEVKEMETAPPVQDVKVSNHDGRIFASPIVRRLARENGLDLTKFVGSGPNGRIVRRDIENSFKTGVGPQSTNKLNLQSPPGSFTDIPHTGMRKAIARRLVESKSTVPHFYLNASVVADEFLNFRSKYNEWAPKKISVTDLLLKASAAAFVDVPMANVIWTDSAIRKFEDSDISIAVATDNGLITPVVLGVNRLSLAQLNEVTSDLINRARAGRLKQNEIEGGSFSITNLGMYGTESFSAIINPPQSAILAVGAAVEKQVVLNGEVKICKIINFTMSVDHRAIDGALAAQWLAAFVKRAENPYWLAV